jgi:ATP synthase protein I
LSWSDSSRRAGQLAAGKATGNWLIKYLSAAQLSSEMSDPQPPPSVEKPSLEQLGGRISKARRAAGLDQSAAEMDATAGAGLGAAWRISIEIVVALVVCTAIGWALDYWFGTKPWLMLLFLFLGGAAGLNNAVRTALRMDAQAAEDLQRKSQARSKAGTEASPDARAGVEKGDGRDG